MASQETVEVFAVAPVTDALLDVLEAQLLTLGGRKPSPFKDSQGRQGAILVVPTDKRSDLEAMPVFADLVLEHRETVSIPVKVNESDSKPVHSINSAIERSAEELALGLPAGGAPPEHTGAQILNTDEPRNSLQTPDEEAAMYALRTASPSPATLVREILGKTAEDVEKEARVEKSAEENLTKLAQAIPIPSPEPSSEPSPAALVAEVLGGETVAEKAAEPPHQPEPAKASPTIAPADQPAKASPTIAPADQQAKASLTIAPADQPTPAPAEQPEPTPAGQPSPTPAQDRMMFAAPGNMAAPKFVQPGSVEQIAERVPQVGATMLPSEEKSPTENSPNKTTEGSLGGTSPLQTPSPRQNEGETEEHRDSTSVAVRESGFEISADDPIRYLFRPTLLFLAGIGAILLQMGGRLARFFRSLTQ